MPTSKNPAASPNYRQMAIAAAYLLAQDKGRIEIMKKLDRGESEIARLLKFAKEMGYLSRAPTFLRHHVNDADWNEVQRRYLVEEPFTHLLEAATPRGLHFEAHMIFGEYGDFIRGAAVCVRQLLRRAKRVGVMWGRTVHLLVENIKAFGERPAKAPANQIECIPLCGDPTHLMNQRRLDYSASWLAGELEKALRHPDHYREECPCLIGVPAYLSRAVRAGVRRDEVSWGSFMHQIPGYEAILAKSSPGRRQPRLAETVDTVILGAGIIAPDSQPWKPSRPSGPSTGDFIEERLLQEKISKEDFAKLVYGDIGGWLLERPGLDRADQKLVAELNQGWTGVEEKDLQRTAAIANEKGGAGTILIASSAAKAEVIHAAIKRGLVNHLVVDEPLKARLIGLVT